MKSWLFLLTLTLPFQLPPITAQDFEVTVESELAVPNPEDNFNAFTNPFMVKSVVHDSTGNFFYLCGYAHDSIDDEQFPDGATGKALLTKHYLNGSRVWSRFFGDADDNLAYRVIQNPATRDLFVTGDSRYPGNGIYGNYDSLLVKFSQNGTTLFTCGFGTANDDKSFDLFLDTKSKVLVQTGTYNGGQAVIVNDMNNGSLLRQFQLPPFKATKGITSAQTGRVCFVTGNSDNVDILLSKVDYLNGTKYWTNTWGTASEDYGYDVQFDPSSQRVFVVGRAGASLNGEIALGGDKAFIICASSNSTLLWTRQFGSSSAQALAIHQPTGTLFVVGSSGREGFVSTFDQNGNPLKSTQQTRGYYVDISFGSSGSAAFIAESTGRSVSLKVSYQVSVSQTPLATAETTNMPPATTLSDAATETPIPKVIRSDVTTQMPPPVSVPSDTKTGAIVVATESVPSSADGVQNQGSGSPSIVPYVMIALGIVGIVAITILSLRLFLSYKKLADSTTQKTETSSDSTHMTGTYMISTTTSMTTMVRSNFELSLPGYLQFKNGATFRINTRIARGGGGSVFTGDCLVPELKQYGPKIIIKTVGDGDGTLLSRLTARQSGSFKQEVAIMHYFREEKYISKLLGWSDEPAALLMKFYELGSLDRDIATGILAMHNSGFVHCDLKPQNVLVDTDNQHQLFCVLTDFGITQVVDDSTLLVKEFAVINMRGLSVSYAAPESFQRFRSGARAETVSGNMVMKVDVYSLGIMMLELVTRRSPW